MDILIFNELKRRGIITSPFLKASDVKDFEELYSKGYITSVWAKSAYNEIIKSLNIEETPAPVEVKETKKEPVVEKIPEPAPKAEETPAPVEVKEDIIVDEGDEKREETKVEETNKSKSSKK